MTITQDDLITLDYSYRGIPFVRGAPSATDLTTLDVSYRGRPYVGQSNAAPITSAALATGRGSCVTALARSQPLVERSTGRGTCAAALTRGYKIAARSTGRGAAAAVMFTPAHVLNVTSDHADGSFTPPDTVDVSVLYSRAVDVTFTPKFGTTAGTAFYLSGTGTATLVFRVSVAIGTSTADMDASTIISSGTIKDLAGNDASLVLPMGASTPGALAYNKAIVYPDITAPVVADLATDDPAVIHYGGETINLFVRMSELVTVASGVPTLALNSGGTATYVDSSLSFSGDETLLRFTYPIGTSDASAALDFASTSALSLNGATIRDAVGNDADLSLVDVIGANALFYQTVVIAQHVAAVVCSGRGSPRGVNAHAVTTRGVCSGRGADVAVMASIHPMVVRCSGRGFDRAVNAHSGFSFALATGRGAARSVSVHSANMAVRASGRGWAVEVLVHTPPSIHITVRRASNATITARVANSITARVR